MDNQQPSGIQSPQPLVIGGTSASPTPEPSRSRLSFLSRSKRATILSVVALFTVLGATGFLLSRPHLVQAQTWIVAPNGKDAASGADTSNALTLQAALDKAKPGDVIQLQPGTYKTSTTLTTKTNGEPGRPITIKGPETGLNMSQRNKAVITGAGHIFDVEHSYYVFDGFTINGQPNLNFNEIPTTPDALIAFKDANQSHISDGRLIYVGNKARDVSGTVINNMFLTGAGGECIRMRSFTTNSKVTNSYIYRCGFVKKSKDYGYHNGEGVYIGTSPKSTDQPFYKNDNSSNNLVQGNIIETYGSECANIKENATNNIVDNNQCRYGLGTAADGSESILEVRGKNNQVTNNVIEHSRGYGIKLWSDTGSEAGGGNNVIANNKLSDIADFTVTLKTQSQPLEICDNTYTATPKLSGLTGIHVDITKKCSKQYPTGVVAGTGTTTPAPTPPQNEKPPVQLTSLSPATGTVKGGYTVTAKVRNLDSGTPSVTFGGTKATNIKRVDSETITTTVPARTTAGSVPVIVQVGDQATSAVFTYTAESTTPTTGGGSTPSTGGGTTTPAPTPPTTGATIDERFTSMANITAVRGGTWKINSEEDLQLADPKTDLSVGNANIAVHKQAVATDYTLKIRAQVKGTSNTFNDFSILFDYADQNNYSFVSFNESNDENTSGIFQVVNGAVKQVADITTKIKADTYYTVNIVHSSDGTVVAKLDGAQVASVKMAQQPGHLVGIGSRNDSALFDDLTVK